LTSYGDTVLAGVLSVSLLAEVTAAGALPARPVPAALAVLATAPVAYRRRLPLASFVVTWTAMLALASQLSRLPDVSITFFVVFVFSFYSLGAHSRRIAALAGGLCVIAGTVLFVATDGDPFAVGDVLFGIVLVGGPWAAGLAMRLRRDRERQLTTRTDELERGQAELARLAVAEERSRIARELHDVVSHAISVTVLHARGGRRMLDLDPAEAREAFTVIERTNAQALGDMRRLLSVLRESDVDGETEPLPSLTAVSTLIESTGLEVEFDISGDSGSIPPGIGLSAYRIVQEALTNVLRHAAGARVRVAVACRDQDLEVVICDDGTGSPGVAKGSGHGLIGMRERVAVAGGELDVGPVDGAGFRVRALLPYEVAA
jgi:signal transduction histidine kinase